MVALHSACQSLVLKECDSAIASGTNMLTSPEMFIGLSKGFFISNTGGCRTFDETADGYCRAEGVGVLVLKVSSVIWVACMSLTYINARGMRTPFVIMIKSMLSLLRLEPINQGWLSLSPCLMRHHRRCFSHLIVFARIFLLRPFER
jgi:hypothetical protein